MLPIGSAVLWFLEPALGPGVVAIAWSRLVLNRHTALEVAVGAALGVAAGVGLRTWG